MINYLSNAQKGILLIICGIILLFHTLGIIPRGLDIIIIIGSIVMIIYGFILADYYKKIRKLIKKEEKDKD